MLKAVRNMFSSVPVKLLDLNAPEFTPDWWRLSAYEAQNIFIYNQFMKGCVEHTNMISETAERKSAAFTVDDRFVMWKKDLGRKTQAFALRVRPDQIIGSNLKTSYIGTPRRLLGQVFKVDPQNIAKLDTELQNGVMYDRERITVYVPYCRRTKLSENGLGDLEIVTVPVWAYVARLDYWSELMNPMDKRCKLVSSYRRNSDGEPYYFYSEANEQTYK